MNKSLSEGNKIDIDITEDKYNKYVFMILSILIKQIKSLSSYIVKPEFINIKNNFMQIIQVY